VKNEKRIVEFIQYYIKIGIDYFIILDDDSDTDVNEILVAENINREIYSVLYTNGRRFLHGIYNSKELWNKELIPLLKQHAIDYVLYVDADEFLYPEKFRNMTNLIKHYEPFDSLKINVLHFGSNNIIENDTNSVIFPFNKSSNKISDWVKCLTKVASICTDPANGFTPNPHMLCVDTGIVKNINNMIVDSKVSLTEKVSSNNYVFAPIYIAHYMCQDITTYIERKVCSKIFLQVSQNYKLTQDVIKLIQQQKNLFVQYLQNTNNAINNNTNDVLIQLLHEKTTLPKETIMHFKNHFKWIDNNYVINNDIINIFCKSPYKPRIAIFSPARNEKHIIEWVNYYIKIGFDYFIIYDDFSDKPIQEVFNENNIEPRLYKIIRADSRQYYLNINDKNHNQNVSYSTFFWKNNVLPELVKNNIEYVFHIDIDEFLYLNTFKNVQELVQYYQPFDVLKINWVIFGSAGLLENTSNSVINTFNKCNPIFSKTTGGLKSLTKVSQIDTHMNISQYGPHCLPILKNSIVKNIVNNVLPTYDKIIEETPFLLENDSYKNNIYIAHYACQDLKTFVKRKFTNKSNIEWMMSGFIKIKSKKEAYEYVDFISANVDEFAEYLYYKKRRIEKEKNELFEKKLPIPLEYIDNMIRFLNFFDINKVENNDIIEFYNS
jgi:hypothetical protein